MIDYSEFEKIPNREISKEERKQILREIKEQNEINKQKGA
jgi:hypothetical protein